MDSKEFCIELNVNAQGQHMGIYTGDSMEDILEKVIYFETTKASGPSTVQLCGVFVELVVDCKDTPGQPWKHNYPCKLVYRPNSMWPLDQKAESLLARWEERQKRAQQDDTFVAGYEPLVTRVDGEITCETVGEINFAKNYPDVTFSELMECVLYFYRPEFNILQKVSLEPASTTHPTEDGKVVYRRNPCVLVARSQRIVC